MSPQTINILYNMIQILAMGTRLAPEMIVLYERLNNAFKNGITGGDLAKIAEERKALESQLLASGVTTGEGPSDPALVEPPLPFAGVDWGSKAFSSDVA